MFDRKLIPYAQFKRRLIDRGDRHPDGRPVPKWVLYSPPPVYGESAQNIVDITCRQEVRTSVIRHNSLDETITSP